MDNAQDPPFNSETVLFHLHNSRDFLQNLGHPPVSQPRESPQSVADPSGVRGPGAAGVRVAAAGEATTATCHPQKSVLRCSFVFPAACFDLFRRVPLFFPLVIFEAE